MQSYRETSSVSQLDPLPGTSRSTSKSRVGGAGDGGDEDEVELGKWRQRYEETMNPFEAFRGRVRGFPVLGICNDLTMPYRKRRKHIRLCHSQSAFSSRSHVRFLDIVVRDLHS
jgi:hypothetical protein